jgi:Alkylmercury lyase
MTETALQQATTAAAREWSPAAREAADFIYGFWTAERRPPSLLDLHQSLDHSPRRLRRIFRELEEGFAVSFQDHLIGLAVDKAPPFSATPTTVAAFTDGRFLSYVGCPMEVFSIGGLPPLETVEITVKSHCACCFTPIELVVRGQEVLSVTPSVPLIAVVRSPYDWQGGVRCDVVCDSYHFALDESHADRFSRQCLRRGTTMTIDQARLLTADIAARRMRDPHLPQIRLEAEPMVAFLSSIGVDVSVWQA